MPQLRRNVRSKASSAEGGLQSPHAAEDNGEVQCMDERYVGRGD